MTLRDCEIIETIANAIDRGVLHGEMPTFTGRDVAHVINQHGYLWSKVNEREVNRLADRLGIFRNRRHYTRDFQVLAVRLPELVQQAAAVKERHKQSTANVMPEIRPEIIERVRRGLPGLS